MSISDIKIKKVIRKMELGEFQKEYKGTTIEVWVNPPIKMLQEVGKLSLEMEDARVRAALLNQSIQSGEKSDENPPEKATEEQIKAAAEDYEAARRAYYTWYSKIWQDSPAEEIVELADKLEREEAALLYYLRDKTQKMIRDYLASAKKG